jgi:hypothetical protein
MQTEQKLSIRYCGSFGKIESFSTPEWPELAVELNSGTCYHLIVVSDHEQWSDMNKAFRNASIAEALRKDGVECPDDVLDIWPHVSRGNF